MAIEVQYNLLIDPTWEDIGNVPPKVPMMTDAAYVEAVREDIRGMAGNKVGAAVLHTLKLWNRVVRITPVRGADAKTCSSPSANFGENKDLFWNRTVSPFLNKYTPFHTRPVWAVVFYTPSAYSPGGACTKNHQAIYPSTYVPTRQEVLVHELVHAIRYMSRTNNPNALSIHNSNLRGFDSVEEFAAILVQNMYQSAVGGKIRADHHGHNELDPSLADSFEFFKVSTRSYAAVENFVTSNKFFTRRLGEIDVPFNPVRAFLKDPKKCLQFSQSRDAQVRDAPLAALLSTLTPGISLQMWQKVMQP